MNFPHYNQLLDQSTVYVPYQCIVVYMPDSTEGPQFVCQSLSIQKTWILLLLTFFLIFYFLVLKNI